MKGQITPNFSWAEALRQEPPDWSPYVRLLEGGERRYEVQRSEIRKNIVEVAGRLQEMRDVLDRPLLIRSWYRPPDHPLEASKPLGGGVHTLGWAVDVAAAPDRQLELIVTAWDVGCRRVGIADDFLHLDWLPVDWACLARPSPWVWSYGK